MLRFFTNQRLPFLLAGLALVPIMILASLFHSYAMNVPLWDDHALKAFILTWEDHGIWVGLKALFSQHNEHRIAFTRFITLLIYSTQGTIQYDTMMFIGNLSLLGMWLIWANGWKNHPDRWIWWALGSWLIFTLALYENFYWGMASLQNFGILFFAIATFFCLSQKPKSKIPYQDIWFLLGLISGFFALFTSGNGLVVPIIGLLLLVVQKRWKALAYSTGFWGLCLLLHFFNFTNRTDLAVEGTSYHASEILWRFLVLSGSVTDTLAVWEPGREGIAVIWGACCAGIVCFFLLRMPFQMLFKKYLPITSYQLILAAFSLFVLGTVLGTVIARMPYPTSILFTSKYKIYSNLLTLLAFSFLSMVLPTPYKRTWAWGGLGLSFLLYINSYLLDYRFHLYTFQDRTADLANLYFADQKGIIPMNQHPYKHPTSTLASTFTPKDALQAPRWVDSVAIQPAEVTYFEFGEDADYRAAYLVITGDSLTQVQPLYQSVQPFFVKRLIRPWGGSLMARVSRLNLPSGLYDTFVWLDQPTGGKWLNVQKTIRIKGYTQPEKPKNW